MSRTGNKKRKGEEDGGTARPTLLKQTEGQELTPYQGKEYTERTWGNIPNIIPNNPVEY